MQVTIEELNATRRRIAVEVPVEDVTAEMDRAFGRVQRQARVKGFRPGHVPRAVLEKFFGDQVRADVLSHLIEHSYSSAVEQSGLKPVGPPEIVPENIERGRPLRYSATIDVRPAIRIEGHRELSAKRPLRAVTDEEVDRALESLRESLAELRPVERRTDVRTGDFVSVDTTASVDGRPVPNGKRENRLIEVGRGTVPPEIDAALLGMTVGDTREVDVGFSAEHPDAEVAGRTVRFAVTLRAIREKVVPPLDDALAKEHGECSTLDELRGVLRDRLAASFTREADESVREQLLDELLKRNPFDAPKALVDRQTESIVDDLLERMGPESEALRRDDEQIEKLRLSVRARAERQVRAVLALDALVEQEGIAVTDDELSRRVDEMASRAGERAERLRAAYGEPATREVLRDRIARERALDAIVASARVEDAAVADRDVAPSGEKG